MIPTGAASTPEERQAGLDGEFQESLEAFDEKLLREQQGAASKRVDQEEAAALEAESSAMGFGGSFGEKPDGSEMEEGVAGGAKGGDDKTSGNRGAVPSDVRSTSGDDIVARQLREAAMKEKDPELREKLWNEYRKYKGIPVKSAPAAKEDSGETRSPAEQATDDSGDSEGSENR